MSKEKMKMCKDLECEQVVYMSKEDLTEFMDRMAWVS